MTEARRQAWTRYWQSGALHSCPTSYAGNYGGAIAESWRQLADRLPRGGRVLDLATGNGPIPRLLLATDRTDLGIDAIDAAQVAPSWFSAAEFPQLRFHPNVWMEMLPFDDSTFDCICSQFGFEYADRPRACGEMIRVLKPGGQVCLVMHHTGSVFSNVASHECEHLRFLLAEYGLLAAAMELAVWVGRMRQGLPVAGSAEANAARTRFNAAQQALEQRIAAAKYVDVLLDVRAEVQAILAKAVDPGASITEYRAMIEEGCVRCEEQNQCALDREQIDELAERLRGHGCEGVQVSELQQAEGILAWKLTCRLAI